MKTEIGFYKQDKSKGWWWKEENIQRAPRAPRVSKLDRLKALLACPAALDAYLKKLDSGA